MTTLKTHKTRTRHTNLHHLPLATLCKLLAPPELQRRRNRSGLMKKSNSSLTLLKKYHSDDCKRSKPEESGIQQGSWFCKDEGCRSVCLQMEKRMYFSIIKLRSLLISHCSYVRSTEPFLSGTRNPAVVGMTIMAPMPIHRAKNKFWRNGWKLLRYVTWYLISRQLTLMISLACSS